MTKPASGGDSRKGGAFLRHINRVNLDALFRNWLKDDALEDFVFVTGQSLRQAICLLSTDCIRLIFGPCTGLLHCASGIYNFFAQSGMPSADIPAMITYSGHEPDRHYRHRLMGGPNDFPGQPGPTAPVAGG